MLTPEELPVVVLGSFVFKEPVEPSQFGSSQSSPETYRSLETYSLKTKAISNGKITSNMGVFTIRWLKLPWELAGIIHFTV